MGETKFKLIKGQAWVQGDHLMQEQLMIFPGSSFVSENTVILIDNIWENLLSDAGSTEYGYKTNGKKYFYWEVKMTDTTDETVEVTVRIECPKPKDGLFEEPYNPDSVTGEYAKYWVNQYKIAHENSEHRMVIQKKSVIFPGTTYVNYETGEKYDTETVIIKNNDIGDISNLLGMF